MGITITWKFIWQHSWVWESDNCCQSRISPTWNFSPVKVTCGEQFVQTITWPCQSTLSIGHQMIKLTQATLWTYWMTPGLRLILSWYISIISIQSEIQAWPKPCMRNMMTQVGYLAHLELQRKCISMPVWYCVFKLGASQHWHFKTERSATRRWPIERLCVSGQQNGFKVFQLKSL